MEAARAKLAQKGLDAIVLNDISRADIGFDVHDNEVTILTAADGAQAQTADGGAPGRGQPDERAGMLKIPRASKTAIAETILDVVERLRARGPRETGDRAGRSSCRRWARREERRCAPSRHARLPA